MIMLLPRPATCCLRLKNRAGPSSIRALHTLGDSGTRPLPTPHASGAKMHRGSSSRWRDQLTTTAAAAAAVCSICTVVLMRGVCVVRRGKATHCTPTHVAHQQPGATTLFREFVHSVWSPRHCLRFKGGGASSRGVRHSSSMSIKSVLLHALCLRSL